MAVPFRRTSKRAKRLRRTHFKLHAEGLTNCPNCGAMIKAHHVCPECGYYDGEQVLTNGKYKVEKAEVKPAKKAKKAAKKAEDK